MKAEIITIGDELLIGQTVDTNSAWMAEQLHLVGIRVNRIVSISDARDAIRNAIEDSFARADLVLMTGGLGPTQDDITKETLAEYFGTELVRNEEVHQGITAFFAARGKPMLEANDRQADLPRDAEILPNTRGTAMGMWFHKDGKTLVSMPGVPYEMKGIMTEHVLTRIRERFLTPVIIHRTVLTQGIGESFLAETISDWETALRNEGFSLAYLPSPGMVKLRISAYGVNGNEAEVQKRIAHYITELERRVPQAVFGRDKDTLASVVGALLVERGHTMSTAESCTGGTIAQLITAIPGSSRYFMGSVVAYSNASKTELIGVDPRIIAEHGAVSKEVVVQMAEGVRRSFGTTWAIATSGVAGPDGGTPEKPVGTVWIAVAGPRGNGAHKYTFGNSRDRNITLSAVTALNDLRKEILAQSFE
jgi:nicotinamide-nucleotide amidase